MITEVITTGEILRASIKHTEIFHPRVEETETVMHLNSGGKIPHTFRLQHS